MAICYYCGCEITKENNSMEHIIPNVLRGRLKKENILCKKCNNDLSTIDKKLASNFEFLNTFLKTKTDRPIDIKVPVKIDGEDAILMLGMQYSSKFKPEIIKMDNRTNFSFKGTFASNDKKEKKKFLKNIQKILKNNGKDIPIDEIEKNSITTENKPLITHQHCLKLDDVMLGYLKIILGFCSFKNKIQYVQEDIFKHFQNFDFNNFKQFIRLIDNNKLKNGRLCNHIYLVGDKTNHKLFCVISIFNYIDIAIILNENYQSESFQENYVFDLIDSKEIQEHINFSFDEIKDNQFDFNIIKNNSIKNYNYFMRFFVSKNINTNDISDKLFDLLDYIYLIKENMLSKEELSYFIKNAFTKAVEKQFFELNQYDIENISYIAHEDFFYGVYREQHSRLNQYFDTNPKYQQCLKILETEGLSKEKIRQITSETSLKNNNIWVEILSKQV